MWPTIASGGPDPAPTRATDEPRLSVETSAKLAAASRQTRAASSSRPDGPRARSSASRSSGAGIARIVCGGASLASGTMRRLLLLVSAIMLVDAVFFSALTPLLPHYAETLHLSKAGAGILTGTFGVGTLVGAIPAGILAARLGPKTVALLGLGLLASTSLAFGFGGNVWVLDAARFLQGVGGACTLEEPFADPRWVVSPCAYLVGLLDPLVIDELELRRRGYRVHPVDPHLWCPFEDGSALAVSDDARKTRTSLETLGVAPKDVEGFLAYGELFGRIRRALRHGRRDTWVGDAPDRDEIEALLGDDREGDRPEWFIGWLRLGFHGR